MKTTALATLAAAASMVALPSPARALTPIARSNVIPHQRIAYGTALTFGVIAFSKAGIDRVEFTISGQGYSGGVKTSRSMALNTRHAHTEPAVPLASWPGVYEYFIELASNEFTTDGVISVTPTVYGRDDGVRKLEAVLLLVEATEPGNRTEAWVDGAGGNDDDGRVGNSARPFATITAAILAAQAANGGSSDGNIIYLQEGRYSLGSAAINTTDTWLTIQNASGASRDNIIIDDGNLISSGEWVKLEGVTLYSGGSLDYVLDGRDALVWIHDCKLTSIGRYGMTSGGDANVYPVRNATYITNSYAFDVDRAASNAQILRNFTAHRIAEDLTRNSPLLVNIRLDDQDNGSNEGHTNYYHSDGYQNFLRPIENEIIYNYYGTDMHYQGLFVRITDVAGGADNVAYVNLFMEMREPGTQGSASGNPGLTAGAVYCDSLENVHWNHLLLWHCSFPHASFNTYCGDGELENVSFIGNLFQEYREYEAGPGNEPGYLEPGNTSNNQVLYNHYKGSYTDVAGCSGNPQPEGCPTWHSKSPDTDAAGTATHGGRYWPEVVDLTDTSLYQGFGYPLTNSGLIDRLPANLTGVPGDALGAPRDVNPDVGALETGGGAPPVDAGARDAATGDDGGHQRDTTASAEASSHPDTTSANDAAAADGSTMVVDGSGADVGSSVVSAGCNCGAMTGRGAHALGGLAILCALLAARRVRRGYSAVRVIRSGAAAVSLDPTSLDRLFSK